jgi:hypothetical protein
MPSDGEQRARIIGEWLQTEARCTHEEHHRRYWPVARIEVLRVPHRAYLPECQNRVRAREQRGRQPR